MSGKGGNDTLALSRLDVISCALGAAILLFLTLSAIRIRPPSETSARMFVHVSVELTSGAAREDAPIITFFVTAPDDPKPFDVPGYAFDPRSGLLRTSMMTSERVARLRETGVYQVAGSCIDRGVTLEDGATTAHLTILLPLPGEWSFRYTVSNSQDPFLTVTGADASLTTVGIMRVMTRTSNQVDSEMSTVQAGTLSKEITVFVQ